MAASTWLTVVNVLLIVSLLYVYLRNMKQVRSGFTLGLVIFAGLFLAQYLVSLYYFFTMMPFFVPEVEPFVLALTVLQLIGLSVLNWITWS